MSHRHPDDTHVLEAPAPPLRYRIPLRQRWFPGGWRDVMCAAATLFFTLFSIMFALVIAGGLWLWWTNR